MKIYKRQTGGVVYTPFGMETTSPQVVNQSDNKKEGADEIQKAIINVLNEQGIPTDVDKFLKHAQAILAKRDFSLFSTGDDSYDFSDLIRLHSLANQVK